MLKIKLFMVFFSVFWLISIAFMAVFLVLITIAQKEKHIAYYNIAKLIIHDKQVMVFCCALP